MEWTGWIPFEVLPHVFDPPEHVIVTANHRPAPPDYPHLIGLEFPEPYRAHAHQRARAREDEVHARGFPHDAGRHVLVAGQGPAAAAPDARRAGLGPGSAGARRAAQVEFRIARADSAGAAIFQAWFLGLAPALAGDELGPQLLEGYQARFSFVTRFVVATLSTPDSTWCDDVTTAGMRETCAEMVNRAFSRGVARSGRRRSATIPRAGAGRRPTARSFRIRVSTRWASCGRGSADRCRAPATGAPSTSARSTATSPFDQTEIPGYRQIIDLSPANDSRFSDSVGQSGHFLSPHYDDALRGLAAGAAQEDADGARRHRRRGDWHAHAHARSGKFELRRTNYEGHCVREDDEDGALAFVGGHRGTRASGQPCCRSSAQQPGSAAGLPDGPQVFRTGAAAIRVTAIKGFVYPWALAFLPNGDMLVTEQGRNTLRIVRNGVLDPRPITGLPQGITSTRRDTAGVEIAVHPRFAENRFVYVAYWKPRPGENIQTAVLLRARFDGGAALTEVREIFQSSSWTDGPSAARIVFGRDGKIYLAIGAPGFAERVGETSWAQNPAAARRQGAAPQRRWERARRQSICRTAGVQAGDLRARDQERSGADHPSRNGRAVGNRKRSSGRRRGQHHQARPELRLADRHLRSRVYERPGGQEVRHCAADRAAADLRAGDGRADYLLQAVDCDLGDAVLHRRQVSVCGRATSSSAGSSACSSRASSSTDRASKPGANRCCSSYGSGFAT